MNIIVQTSSFNSTTGLLIAGTVSFPCVLGRTGVTADKREGDGKTPIGTYPLRRLFYRADRLDRPVTGLHVQEIKPDDGWCDESAHADYNRLVKKPFAASHEDMFRDDHLYDLVAEVGYTADPPVPGQGSAIFMHLARPERTPTAGCIALSKEDMLQVLALCGPDSLITILPPTDS